MKSCIDLIIVSKVLLKYLDFLEIDKNKNFTPFHSNKKKTLTFPDHYAQLLVFRNIPAKKMTMKGGKITRWNTKKVGGWEGGLDTGKGIY